MIKPYVTDLPKVKKGIKADDLPEKSENENGK